MILHNFVARFNLFDPLKAKWHQRYGCRRRFWYLISRRERKGQSWPHEFVSACRFGTYQASRLFLPIHENVYIRTFVTQCRHENVDSFPIREIFTHSCGGRDCVRTTTLASRKIYFKSFPRVKGLNTIAVQVVTLLDTIIKQISKK